MTSCFSSNRKIFIENYEIFFRDDCIEIYEGGLIKAKLEEFDFCKELGFDNVKKAREGNDIEKVNDIGLKIFEIYNKEKKYFDRRFIGLADKFVQMYINKE